MAIKEKLYSITASLHGVSIELRHVVAQSTGEAAREGIDKMIETYREAFELPDSHNIDVSLVKVHVRREEKE